MLPVVIWTWNRGIKMNEKIITTGAAGFIGYQSRLLLEKGYQIIGGDNLNKYYSPQLKEDRLTLLKKYSNNIAAVPASTRYILSRI